MAVSLPQRDYQLAGRLLARAVTDAEREGIAVGLALGRAARRTGRALGDRARRVAGARPTPTDLLAAAMGVLVECGYEPRTDGTGLVLANCPFHGLVEEYTDLVCGMNLDLLSGLLDGLHHPDLRPASNRRQGCAASASERPTIELPSRSARRRPEPAIERRTVPRCGIDKEAR